MSDQKTITWEPQLEDKFKTFILKMPIFHRRMAEQLIKEQATENARQRSASAVNEEDFLKAVFSGVPKPFYTIMLRLLDELGFDYVQYGLPNITQ